MTRRRGTQPAEAPGPSDFRDPLLRHEFARASVWLGLALAIALAALLVQPLLLIVGGIVFASLLDGGARLIGRVLPIGRGLRLAIVCVLAILFLAWTGFLAGSQLAAQAENLTTVVTRQISHILAWAQTMGFAPANAAQEINRQIMGSIGQVSSALGSALGAI